MGLKFNNNKRQRIIKGNPRETLFISINWNTKYTGIQSSYDLTSDHSPITATLSTSVIVRKPTPRLHNSKTNWDTYRQIIQDKVNLSIKLKEHKGTELETNNLPNLLHHAAKEATPNSDPKKNNK
jgi:hypothetical protein